MSTSLLLWLAGGAAAVMAMMLVAVVLARKLDRDAWGEKPTFDRIMDVAAKMKGAGGLAAAAGPVVAMLAHASNSSTSDEQKSGDPKAKIKALITGLAIAGGVIMLIIGILAGEG